MYQLVVTPLTPIYTAGSGVMTFPGDVSLLETPETESFGEYYLDSSFHVQLFELTALMQPVVSIALWTGCLSASFSSR